MPLLSIEGYVKKRQSYDYNSPETEFKIKQAGNLTYVGNFKGVFARDTERDKGVNLRKFELICREVFENALNAEDKNSRNEKHNSNIKNIAKAIVHWKWSSQCGRSKFLLENMLKKFDDNLTTKELLNAFREGSLEKFRIGGVRIPTATAFMRFLFPDKFGIMDSRVVGNYTQPHGITTLNLSQKKIEDSHTNINKYYGEYNRFLREERDWLNSEGVKFKDVNRNGQTFDSLFRVCDVEMALFV